MNIESARKYLLQIYQAALNAVDGRKVVADWLQNRGFESCAVIAVGKAAESMLLGAQQVLQERSFIPPTEDSPGNFRKAAPLPVSLIFSFWMRIPVGSLVATMVYILQISVTAGYYRPAMEELHGLLR